MEKFFKKYSFYILLGFGIVCAASILLPLYSFEPQPDKALEIAFIDVGQADSALIVCPDGKAVLVDAGADLRCKTPEEGAQKSAKSILSLLEQKGVRRLHKVFISHTDFDHIGALGRVMKKIPVTTVVAAEPERQAVFKHLSGAFKNVKYSFAGAGDSFDFGGGVKVDCLYPYKTNLDLSAAANSRSLVFMLSYDMFSALFTGDIGPEAMNVLRHQDKKVSLLKVPHHGAFCPELKSFVSMLEPRASVISCGRSNSYGHPDEKTLRVLAQNQMIWARTDRNGNITVRSSGWGFCVQTQRRALRNSGVLEPSETAVEP